MFFGNHLCWKISLPMCGSFCLLKMKLLVLLQIQWRSTPQWRNCATSHEELGPCSGASCSMPVKQLKPFPRHPPSYPETTTTNTLCLEIVTCTRWTKKTERTKYPFFKIVIIGSKTLKNVHFLCQSSSHHAINFQRRMIRTFRKSVDVLPVISFTLLMCESFLASKKRRQWMSDKLNCNVWNICWQIFGLLRAQKFLCVPFFWFT